jgi:hypothetical protein
MELSRQFKKLLSPSLNTSWQKCTTVGMKRKTTNLSKLKKSNTSLKWTRIILAPKILPEAKDKSRELKQVLREMTLSLQFYTQTKIHKLWRYIKCFQTRKASRVLNCVWHMAKYEEKYKKRKNLKEIRQVEYELK